jgi:hypothetical protein
MSPLYSDAQVSREAGKKIGIREIELSEVGTIDFENTELEVTFAAPGDENVDCAFYAVIRQQRWCGESRFVLEVVGNHDLPGMETRSRLAIPYLSQAKYCQSFLAPSLRPRRPAGAFRRACIREDRDERFRLPGAFEINSSRYRRPHPSRNRSRPSVMGTRYAPRNSRNKTPEESWRST